MENCKECPYRAEYCKEATICEINSVINPRRCPLPDGGIENKKVCYNCAEWIGGGDFGLSCRKHYYVATTDGLRDACEDFSEKDSQMTKEQKEKVHKFYEFNKDCMSDDDVVDFCNDNDLPVRETFHLIAEWTAPECCRGCKHIEMSRNMYPCNMCCRAKKDFYEKREQL